MLLIDIRKVRKRAAIAACFLLFALIIILTRKAVQTQAILLIEGVQYKDYSALNGRFTYKLPADWKTVEQKFGGNEIIYHNDFESADKKVHGYVQIWNLNKPLVDFLKQSQKSSAGIVYFKNYTVEPIKIDNRDGYVLQYSRRDEKNKYLKAFEVFIMERNNTFCRFAFYMDEDKWKNEYREFFLNTAAYGKVK